MRGLDSEAVRRLPYSAAYLVSAALAGGLCACNSSPDGLTVTISLSQPRISVTAVTVVADYSESGARLVMSGSEPACAVLPPDMKVAFTNEAGDRLRMVVSSTRTFSAPIDLAVCRMSPAASASTPQSIAAALRFSVLAAVDADGQPWSESQIARLLQGTLRDASVEAAGARDLDPNEAADYVGGGGEPRDAPPAAGDPRTARPDPQETLRERTTSSAVRDERRREEREREGLEAREAASAAEGQGSLDDPIDSYAEDPDADDGFEEDEENDPDVRRTTPAYDVYMDVVSSSGAIAALRFNVAHTGSTGGWEGSKEQVPCTWHVNGGLTLCTDPGAGRLRCALVDDVGFETPAPVVSCTFRSIQEVAAYNFNVEVIDAFGPDDRPIAVDMLVTSVVPR